MAACEPRSGRDNGRELYYVQPDGKVVAVEVSNRRSDAAHRKQKGRGALQSVFPDRALPPAGELRRIEGAGKRFLVNEALGQEIASPVNLVLGGPPPGK